jgi:hypothetical protein
MNVEENNEHAHHILSNLSGAHRDDDRLLSKTNAAWLCVTAIFPCLIICDIFERNAEFLSSQSKRYWRVLTQLSFCSSLGRQDKNLAAIQCICNLSIKMLRTDPNEIPNMLATS